MAGAGSATGPAVRAAPERLAAGLRQVARRARGLPEGERQRALELYLSYQLRGEERPRVPGLLRETLERLAPGRVAAPTAEPASGPAAGAGPGRPGTPADPSPGALEALVSSLRSLPGVDDDPGLAPAVLVEQVQARLAAVEGAVQQTAQEFFDRLLQALDPDTARAFVGKPGLRPAPLYKAAVFDAYAEKFSQLAEYHGKGRLVRDFRASFKRNLRG